MALSPVSTGGANAFPHKIQQSPVNLFPESNSTRHKNPLKDIPALRNQPHNKGAYRAYIAKPT